MNRQARHSGAVLFAALAISWYGIPVQAQVGQSPEATAKEFYGWYLHALAQSQEPLLKHKVSLKKYVTAGLLSQIERRMKSSEGLSLDYFLQAQDWLEDWEGNIATTKTAVTNTIATTVVILGATEESRHKLTVSLRLESGAWRITSVRPLP